MRSICKSQSDNSFRRWDCTRLHPARTTAAAVALDAERILVSLALFHGRPYSGAHWHIVISREDVKIWYVVCYGMLLYDSMIWIQTLIVHSGNLVDHTGISPGDGWCTLFVVCRGTGIPEIPQPHSVQSLHCHRCTTSKRKHKKSQVRKGHKPWQSSSKLFNPSPSICILLCSRC